MSRSRIKKRNELILWVSEIRLTSCGLLIFVEEAAEAVASSDVDFPGGARAVEWA